MTIDPNIKDKLDLAQDYIRATIAYLEIGRKGYAIERLSLAIEMVEGAQVALKG